MSRPTRGTSARRRSASPARLDRRGSDDHSVGAVSWRGAGEFAGQAPRASSSRARGGGRRRRGRYPRVGRGASFSLGRPPRAGRRWVSAARPFGCRPRWPCGGPTCDRGATPSPGGSSGAGGRSGQACSARWRALPRGRRSGRAVRTRGAGGRPPGGVPPRRRSGPERSTSGLVSVRRCPAPPGGASCHGVTGGPQRFDTTTHDRPRHARPTAPCPTGQRTADDHGRRGRTDDSLPRRLTADDARPNRITADESRPMGLATSANHGRRRTTEATRDRRRTTDEGACASIPVN